MNERRSVEVSETTLAEALENAIAESIGSDGSEITLTVPNIVAAVEYIESESAHVIENCKRLPDGSFEMQGYEDGVMWSLYLKEKP